MIPEGFCEEDLSSSTDQVETLKDRNDSLDQFRKHPRCLTPKEARLTLDDTHKIQREITKISQCT